jgi:protein-S-isoprenylcysteine O-methyltransferase Ste14
MTVSGSSERSVELRSGPVAMARAYFGLQAVAGSVWWVAVWASDDVRAWTLGSWDPAVLVWPDLAFIVGASAVAAVFVSRVAAVVAAVWTTAVTVALGIYGVVSQEAGWGVVLMTLSAVGTLAACATLWFGDLPTGWFFIGPFSFRVADEAPGRRHLRRSLLQLVVFWTTFFVVVPLVLAGVEERLVLEWPALDRTGVRAVGAAAFILGSGVGLWSCVTMALRGMGTPLPAATARDLVISGPYRWVRNPMAVAGVLQTAGVGLMVGSWLVVAIAVAGAVVWNTVIRPVEEADLAERFGAQYCSYTDDVRCWIPRRPSPGPRAPV